MNLSRAEVGERRAAGSAPPLCPVCGHGNLAGRWEGPLGQYDTTAVAQGALVRVERGEWMWECGECGESGPWVPGAAYKADPFTEGRAVWEPSDA